mmetsp:Transcript_7455/g.14115  ORF Transcript_7455/g.14115 Transcript_7455/m.14115 type:complete len:123 (-) Transcript_7455:125-493(-)
MKTATVSFLFLLVVVVSQAFVPSWTGKPISLSSTSNISSRSTTLRKGSMEQIEFKIYPDGRVEEVVRGVKGGECHKVTDEINKSLGKVIDSKPTEEMYEQSITIEETVQVKNDNGWEGSSSW